MEDLYIKLSLVGIGSILIVFCIYFNSRNFLEDYDSNLRLIIPKINFDMKLYDLDSKFNNVDYNVEILKNSYINDNLFYIAGHSGGCDYCYFDNIRFLIEGDFVYIYNGYDILIYKIKSKYYINKNGYMITNNGFNYLYLITCDIYNSNRQLILEGYLIN